MRVFRRFWLLLIGFCVISKVAAPAPAPDNLLLGRHHVGRLMAGMAESAIYKAFPRAFTRKVTIYPEGIATPAVQVFLRQNQTKPSLVVWLTGQAVYGFDVRDPKFRTKQGIRVGSTIAELRKSRLKFTFSREEGDGLLCEELGMKLVVTIDSASDQRLQEHGGDPLALISPGMRVESIWISGGQSSRLLGATKLLTSARI